MRAISDPGCDHHDRCRDRNRELVLRDHRAPHPGVAANSANLGAEDRLDLKTRGVAIEVIHHLRATDKAGTSPAWPVPAGRNACGPYADEAGRSAGATPRRH